MSKSGAWVLEQQENEEANLTAVMKAKNEHSNNDFGRVWNGQNLQFAKHEPARCLLDPSSVEAAPF
jgi:hypothetical protein